MKEFIVMEVIEHQGAMITLFVRPQVILHEDHFHIVIKTNVQLRHLLARPHHHVHLLGDHTEVQLVQSLEYLQNCQVTSGW